VYLKQFRSSAGKLAPLGFQNMCKGWAVLIRRKMCLYKPEIFAWNGTLPSKQGVVIWQSWKRQEIQGQLRSK
jgi:hypothetical protein